MSSSGTASFFSDVVFTKPQTFRASYSTVANSDPKVVIKTILSDGNYVAITGYGTYVTNKSSVTAAPIKNPKNVFVLPSSTSITNGSYPFSRYLYFYALTTSIATKAKAYIDYGLSVAGSAALARTGYIALPATIIKQMLGRIGG